MIYVILGMHKSGTTLVSQILHHSGINMADHIDEQISYDQGNKYERESTLHLDMDILGAEDYSIIDLPRPEHLTATEAQLARMRHIISQCNEQYPNWGFKDPRACLTYPLWASELPEHKIIAIYRPPEEIWPRFRYDGFRYYYTNPSRAMAFAKRWHEHNGNILEFIERTRMQYLVLNYHALMKTDSEFERLAAFVGKPLTDCRDTSLFRSRTRTYFLLKLAFWRLSFQVNSHPRDIIKRFEALRLS